LRYKSLFFRLESAVVLTDEVADLIGLSQASSTPRSRLEAGHMNLRQQSAAFGGAGKSPPYAAEL